MTRRSRFALVLAGTLAIAAATTAARQLAGRPAEEWVKTLEAPERIAGLKIDDVIARLAPKPGNVVADLGAGTGIFSLPFAKAVGPTGKVYAVEIDKAFVAIIAGRVKDQGVANIQALLGKPTDPALPAADVDIAFMHDVLHHVEDREGYVRRTARYLKPGGRFVVIEFNPDASPHRDDAKLVVSKDQANGWMTAAGLTRSDEFNLFTDKWFVVWTRK